MAREAARTSGGMVLSGGLSNLDSQDLLQCLTSSKTRKGAARRRKSRPGLEGKRRFGTVGGAVVQVLSRIEGEMRLNAIHSEVEKLLGSSVSRLSVSDYLIRRSKGRRPLFERSRHGHYRLLR
jgi:hypothetical protein